MTTMTMPRTAIAASLVLLAGACEADRLPAAQAAHVARAASCDGSSCPALVQTFDLISPETCELAFGRLRKCAIPPQTLIPPPVDAAVPMRTVLRRVRSGNCSTAHALQLAVDAPTLEGEQRFRYIADEQLVLRAPGGAPLERLEVADGYPKTGTTTFDGSCRIAVEISVNEPDVDSAEEARSILAAMELELVRATRERESYRQLMVFYGAHEFLLSVADNLHREVTSELMQELRARYVETLPAFDALAAAGSCADELGADHAALLELAVALFALGDPADWQNPDGTTKTLADLYSEFRGDGVVAQIEQLAAEADPALEEQYRVAYEEAALAVAELEARLALAREQLAPWLEETE